MLHPKGDAKLATPTREFLGVTTPLLKIKNGNDFRHVSVEIVFSSVYYKIGAINLSSVLPLPIAITSIPLACQWNWVNYVAHFHGFRKFQQSNITIEYTKSMIDTVFIS